MSTLVRAAQDLVEDALMRLNAGERPLDKLSQLHQLLLTFADPMTTVESQMVWGIVDAQLTRLDVPALTGVVDIVAEIVSNLANAEPATTRSTMKAYLTALGLLVI